MATWGESNRLAPVLCYRCGSHVPDTAERCGTCGQRQVGTARMPSATGLRKKLNPALLAGAPYREGELMADRYLVKDAVGVGPLGFVLRTQDRELGIDVSVKLIHPRFVQTNEERTAFQQALDPARRFLHPSLTRLHDVGVDQGWPFFTYTFLDGLPLRRIIDLRLAKGQTFALDEVEPILGQLMAALEAAHPSGAHGGLKAENVLVLPDMLKVTDWGVASGVPRPPFVQAERQKAVHRHLAPEYLAGLPLEPRSDVYALGVLVGEMLTGLTPEDEIPELRLVNPDLPDAIEGFYRRALSERPESRFRSVREMFEAFLAVAEGKPVSPPVSAGAAAAPAAAMPSVEAPSADAGAEDGFEVDFVEAQTIVVQPEPVLPALKVDVAPAAEALSGVALAEAPAAAETTLEAAPPLAALPPEAEAEEAEAVAEVEAEAVAEEPVNSTSSGEAPFWSEDTAVSTPAAHQAPAPETLWSDDEEEVDSEAAVVAEEETTPAPEVSLGQPSGDVAPASAAAPRLPETAPEAEVPAARPLPVVPRIGVPALAVTPAVRPTVPSIGLWGPGARRTGAHAAVAIALPESHAAPPVAPSAVAAMEARTEAPAPPPVRPLPTPAPLAAIARVEVAAAAAAVPLRPVEPSPPQAPAPAAMPASQGAHQGGVWSPGAALAELVSEMRAEDARRLTAGEADLAPAAKAAQTVTDQRASRERLALMSASEEPTVPVPAVSGRRKVPVAPEVARPAQPAVKFWQSWRVLLAAVVLAGLLIGGLAAVLLSKVH